MKAIAYCRISKNDPDSLSIEYQRGRLQAYAEMRGLEIVEYAEDNGVSGSVPFDERPGSQRVLQAIRQRRVQHVLALRLDRLFRNCADCLATTSGWDRHGVAFHLIDLGGQTFDTTSPMGRFFLTVMAGVAELERNLIADRTKAALSVLKANNKRSNRFAPFGFRFNEDDEVVVDRDENVVVLAARALRRAGLGYAAIAKRLNSLGHRSRAGTPFAAVQVIRMLAR